MLPAMSVSNKPLRAAATSLVLAMTAAPAAAFAAAQSESYQVLVAQIDKSQVSSATITRKTDTAHVTLTDGRQFTVVYPAGFEPRLAGALTSHGATVHVTAATASGHIRYRYIALAIVVLGALAALAYYLMRGRSSPPSATTGEARATDAQAAAPPPAGSAPAGGEPPPAGGAEGG